MELISRKEVLKLMRQYFIEDDDDLRAEIKTLPIIESRPKGEWICYQEVVREPNGIGYEVYYECSNCHDDILGDASMNFCPNCGADMRGEE